MVVGYYNQNDHLLVYDTETSKLVEKDAQEVQIVEGTGIADSLIQKVMNHYSSCLNSVCNLRSQSSGEVDVLLQDKGPHVDESTSLFGNAFSSLPILSLFPVRNVER